MTTETETPIPTLTAVQDAHALLEDLAARHEWVSVFWDRGWGESPLEISIIVDGDGQDPKAWITTDVYRALLDQKTIQPNSLATHKARKLHDYQTPPPAEPTGPDPGVVAEQLIRSVMDTMADKPIRAEFYRGLDITGRYPKVLHEIVKTPGRPAAGFVLILPGGSSAAISAQVPDFLGPRIVGKATVVEYPRIDGEDVDVTALAGDEFRARLVGVIEDRLAAVAAERADKEG